MYLVLCVCVCDETIVNRYAKMVHNNCCRKCCSYGERWMAQLCDVAKWDQNACACVNNCHHRRQTTFVSIKCISEIHHMLARSLLSLFQWILRFFSSCFSWSCCFRLYSLSVVHTLAKRCVKTETITILYIRIECNSMCYEYIILGVKTLLNMVKGAFDLTENISWLWNQNKDQYLELISKRSHKLLIC